MTTIACPDCSSNRIAHVERAFVRREVAEFKIGAGGAEVVRFTEGRAPEFTDSEPVEFPFVCMDCGAELIPEDLAIEGAQ